MKRINPLYFVIVIIAIVLVGLFLIISMPVSSQETEEVPVPTYTPPPDETPEYVVYLPLVINWTYPWETFQPVGSRATFDGFNGMYGKAIVAGLQTLAININSDGTTNAEIWLCKWPDLEHPVWVVGILEQKVYNNEWLWVSIPWDLYPDSADFIVVYGTGPYTGVLAAGQFTNW